MLVEEDEEEGVPRMAVAGIGGDWRLSPASSVVSVPVPALPFPGGPPLAWEEAVEEVLVVEDEARPSGSVSMAVAVAPPSRSWNEICKVWYTLIQNTCKLSAAMKNCMTTS